MTFHENILPLFLDKNKRDYVAFVENRLKTTDDEDNAANIIHDSLLDA